MFGLYWRRSCLSKVSAQVLHLQRVDLAGVCLHCLPKKTKCLNKRLWCSEWCKQAKTTLELLTCFIFWRTFVNTMLIKIKRFVVERTGVLGKYLWNFNLKCFEVFYFFPTCTTTKKQTEEISKASHTQKTGSNVNKISFTTKFKFLFMFYFLSAGAEVRKDS